MKMKNIPVDIKSKSLNEAKSEIADILERLENENVDLESSTKDYERLLSLNRYIDSLFRERLNKIRSTEKKNNLKK
ncbi:MAG: exonuclease VII small subunit [Pelagibacteraceae bacterium]|nr:exonuclease VII small subunit [Pelagibacteraceae bacterium]